MDSTTKQKSKPKYKISQLRLHSATSVPSGKINFTSLNPIVKLKHIQMPYNSFYKSKNDSRVFPVVKKCNSSRCCVCHHLEVNSTIKSTINNRIFNIKLDKDIS